MIGRRRSRPKAVTRVWLGNLTPRSLDIAPPTAIAPSPCTERGKGVGFGARLPCSNRLFSDSLEHTGQRVQHFIVPEPQDAEAQPLQAILSPPVLLPAGAVRPTIKLNHQPRFRTVEVRDEPVDCMLTTKPHPGKLATPQVAPEQLLGWRRFATHMTRQSLESAPDLRWRLPNRDTLSSALHLRSHTVISTPALPGTGW